MIFSAGQHIHVVGIGGFGMSAIARILLERGFSVSGSDRNQNDLTAALSRDGAMVYHGHSAAHVEGADMLLISSAIPPDLVEVAAARERGIPVYKRREILADLMQGQYVIAVAGTHGKTTTTSMIVHILTQSGHDPSFIVGGVMAGTGTNAGVGQGDLFVIEADEYDYMFLGLKPDLIVLTSLEYDHPDFFESWAVMRDAFHQFVNLLPEDGILIACGDDAGADQLLREQVRLHHERELTDESSRKIVSYGVDFLDFVDVLGLRIRVDDGGVTAFDLEIEGKISAMLGTARFSMPGKHNVQNALAAICATNQLGVSVTDAAKALESFQTTGRRFDIRGEAQGIIVIDDYAHHPTAIRYTLDAAHSRFPQAEIWAVWQPHMYSRTQKLISDYAASFILADHVIVTEIYAARENPIFGVDGFAVAASINHPDSRFVGDFEAIAGVLLAEAKAPAVVVIMSAGDAPRIGELLLESAREG